MMMKKKSTTTVFLSLISRKLFVRNSLLNHNLFFVFHQFIIARLMITAAGMGSFFLLLLSYRPVLYSLLPNYMIMLSLPDHDATLVSLWIS